MQINYLECGCPEKYCTCDNDEHDYLLDDTYPCGCCMYCGCSCDTYLDDVCGELDLTEEDLQLYDDNCEEYEEQKRKRLQLEQEY